MVSKSLKHLLADSEGEEESDKASNSQVIRPSSRVVTPEVNATATIPNANVHSTEEADARLLLSLISPVSSSTSISTSDKRKIVSASIPPSPAPSTASPPSSLSNRAHYDYHRHSTAQPHHDIEQSSQLDIPASPPTIPKTIPPYKAPSAHHHQQPNMVVLKELSHQDPKMICEFVSSSSFFQSSILSHITLNSAISHSTNSDLHTETNPCKIRS